MTARPSQDAGTARSAGIRRQTTRTFLFTDVEGHSALWEGDPDAANTALELHDRLVTDAVVGQGGRVLKYEGDGVMAVFEDPADAVSGAADAQAALGSASWPTEALRVRMGIHVGSVYERDGDYFGQAVNLAARLCDAANGGQVIASELVCRLVDDYQWIALGDHRFRGIGRPTKVHQLVIGEQHRFPPLRHVEAGADRLPRPLTPFIGRSRELEEVVQAVTNERLVSLVCIGGGGKTRLALEAARASVDEFPDGADFLDLSSVADDAAVPGTLLSMLGLDADDPRRPIKRVSDYYAARRALLIIDNCEHLLDAVGDLVDALIGAAPGVHILATTREPLHVDGERIIQVPSLEIESAVALFVDRAPVLLDDEQAVTRICERLDGIPLAIELAAARCSHLSIAEIADRLDDRFRLLTGGRRRVQRQQTLAATLDWSYNLLPETERAMLRRLSTFVGPLRLEWVTLLYGGDDAADVVDSLGSLVDRSLITYDSRTGRYRMLETVRLYSQQQLLEAGEAEEWRDRHRDAMKAHLCRYPLEATILASEVSQELAEDYADLSAAVRWSIENEEWEEAAELAHRLPGVAALADAADVSRWLGQIASHIDPDSDLGFKILAAGVISYSFESERPDHRARDQTADQTRDRLFRHADRAESRDDGIAILARVGLGLLLGGHAVASGDSESNRRGTELWEGALLDADRAGPTTAWTSYTYGIAGILAMHQGNLDRAATLARKASGLDGGFANPEYLAAFAFMLQMQGNPDAITHARAARDRVRTGFGLFTATSAIALSLANRGDVEAAWDELAGLAPDAGRAGSGLQALYVITAAGVALASGDAKRASRWLAAAASDGGTFTTPNGFYLYAHLRETIRLELEPADVRRLRDEGSTLGRDGACRELAELRVEA